MPLGQLHHRGVQTTGHQLGLQLLNQAISGGLTSTVSIEGDQQLLHPLAPEELQLQLRDACTQAGHRIGEPRLVELDHIQRALHQQRGALLANRLCGLIQPKHQPVALEEQVPRAVAVFGLLVANGPAAKAHGLARGVVEGNRQTAAGDAQLPGVGGLWADATGLEVTRPLTALLPTILALRDDVLAERGYQRPIRIGAAGGLGTPGAVAAAFALGASYVLTGSVNQACVESGMSAAGRAMLAEAGLADVVMAPAADMFELGVEVQVLRRGTLFGTRARKLYELYRRYDALEAIPADERAKVERDMLRSSFEQAWADTRAFWANRDPQQVERAERDPKHRMALVFRSYLGQASHWSINGVEDRRSDYQIWCGPAMGSFNAWTRGSFLAEPTNREVVQVARNLIEGAAVITRAQQLRSFGVPMPAATFDYRPRPLQ